MAIRTAWATSLLDEASAIVEAEWIRLQQDDEALWERELADLSADRPTPRPGAPRVSVITNARRPGRPVPEDRRGWPLRRWPPTPVWATQRSPPSRRETC